MSPLLNGSSVRWKGRNVTEVMLSEALESSLEHINKLKINPAINDLFMRKGNYKHLHPYQVKRKMLYAVDSSFYRFI